MLNLFNVVMPIAYIDCYNIVYMETTTESTKISMNQEIVGPSMSNNQRRNVWLWLCVSVVVVIVLLAIGVFFNSRELPKDNSTAVIEPIPVIVTSQNSSTDEILVSPTTVVQDDLLVNWKSFSNAYLSIRFPPDVTLVEREASEIVLQKWGPTQKTNTEFYDGISISLQPFELPLTAEEFARVKIEEVERNGIGEITKPLVSIQIGKYSGFTFSANGLGEHQTTVFKSPSDMIIVLTNSTNDPGNLGFSQIVDSILATLELK